MKTENAAEETRNIARRRKRRINSALRTTATTRHWREGGGREGSGWRRTRNSFPDFVLFNQNVGKKKKRYYRGEDDGRQVRVDGGAGQLEDGDGVHGQGGYADPLSEAEEHRHDAEGHQELAVAELSQQLVSDGNMYDMYILPCLTTPSFQPTQPQPQ